MAVHGGGYYTLRLSDKDLGNYVTNKLALPGDKRNEFRRQVNRLLDKLEAVLAEDGSYRIQKFRRAGSLEKGTSNRPRAGKPADADVGVYFEVDDPEAFETMGNDNGLEDIFTRQFAGVIQPGDVAWGLNTSGNSANVVRALETAQEHGAKTIAFSGGEGGKVSQLADLCLVISATIFS